MHVEVGSWVAFSGGQDFPRLVGQVVEMHGSGDSPADPVELRVWCAKVRAVLPVKQRAIEEVIADPSWVLPKRRASADGS